MKGSTVDQRMFCVEMASRLSNSNICHLTMGIVQELTCAFCNDVVKVSASVFFWEILIFGRKFHGWGSRDLGMFPPLVCQHWPVWLENMPKLCCQFLETIWKLRLLHQRNLVSRSSRIKNLFSPVRCAMPSPWGWPAKKEVWTFRWTFVGRGRMLYSGGWLKSGRIPSCQIPVEMLNHIKLIIR